MRQYQCEPCGETFPINETLQVGGRILCGRCGERVLPALIF